MIERLYIHNFRSLENFELPIQGLSSALLIGKNGTGKSTRALSRSFESGGLVERADHFSTRFLCKD